MHKILSTCLIVLFSNLYVHSQSQGNADKKIDFTPIHKPYKTISPFFKELRKLDDQNLQKKVHAFWEASSLKSLPLIEEDTLDGKYQYVSLICREKGAHKELSFEVFGIYSDYSLGNRKLYRLGDTDLYYRCYKFPKDICFSYRFVCKDTLTGEESKMTDSYNPNRIPYGEVKNYSYSVFDPKAGQLDWGNEEKEMLHRMDTLKYTDQVVKRERNIYVYLPPAYDSLRTGSYPVIYLFDAFIYLHRVEVPHILNRLIKEGKIEPVVAVLFGTYGSTRDSILPLKFDFMKEFTTDLIPLIREKYHVSYEPEKNLIGGMSYGGLAAAFIAFYHPELFGKVLGQSSSFWRDLDLLDEEGKWIRDDWLIHQYASAEKKDLKMYLDWGLQEHWVLGSNRRMLSVLRNREYDVKFVEFNGWHDWANSRQTFAEALEYLLE